MSQRRLQASTKLFAIFTVFDILIEDYVKVSRQYEDKFGYPPCALKVVKIIAVERFPSSTLGMMIKT